MPDEASPNSITTNKNDPNNGFSIPWGHTWRNRTQLEASQCLHFVERKDFIGFDKVLKFCRTKKNIFQIKMKQKVVPRSVTRHLVEWQVATKNPLPP